MAGLVIVAIGTEVGAVMVGAGLFVFGFGAGQWDVAMNVEGSAVEQQLERAIMSRFHAAFSIGTVAGALVGAGMNAVRRPADVPPRGDRRVGRGRRAGRCPRLSPGEVSTSTPTSGDERSPLKAWTERRTVLIGLFVLCMTFAEGTGNDWLGVAAIDGYGASAALGSLAYVLFVASMTAGRWFGPRVLDRFGRVLVLRAGALCAMAGVLVVVFGPSLATALIGIILWGLGAALGFPTGMSAAADEPRYAAGRVSTVATIGYVAFLAGPSLIGLIGNETGVLRALTVTAGLLALGFAVAGSTRPLEVAPPVDVPS